MKQFLILILFLSFSFQVQAKWYVVNIDNQVIAVMDYEPDRTDLESREEIVVFTLDNIELRDAEYRGGKIIKHKKTSDELKAKEKLEKEMAESTLIRKRMKKIARDQLIEEGLIK